jgi:hypothetical protein
VQKGMVKEPDIFLAARIRNKCPYFGAHEI